MSGLLEGFGDHALVLGASTGAVMVHNFGMGRHKAAQGLRVFVVDCANFVAAKIALFFYLWLAVAIAVITVVVGWAHKMKLNN